MVHKYIQLQSWIRNTLYLVYQLYIFVIARHGGSAPPLRLTASLGRLAHLDIHLLFPTRQWNPYMQAAFCGFELVNRATFVKTL